MQTSLKIMNRAIWNFQLLPLSIFHTFYIGGSSPLTVLKYPKMTMSFLNLLEILEIKMQEAWCTKPINNIYRYCLSLLSNKEMYNAEVLVLMSSEKLHRKKKITWIRFESICFEFCLWVRVLSTCLIKAKQNRTTTETPKTNPVSPYWLSQPETVWRALYSSVDERRHQGIQAHIPSQITKCGHANQTQPRRSCKR